MLTNINYQHLFEHHLKSHAAATIALHQRGVNIDYGVVDYGKNNQLIQYREKPSFSFDVSMGINVINKASVKNLITSNQFLNIPDLMMKISEDGGLVNCYKEDCEWLDIGRLEDYQRAIKIFENDPKKFLPEMLCKR